jgi:leucyl-tRNA synthetase/REP element-mobilizing transposase RayT
MSDSRKPFPFSDFEPAWQSRWDTDKTFRTPGPGDPGFDPAKPKYYVLDMFPYPSGAGLHVGHPEGYTATDIIGRFKRMQGFNVLHPMGYDSFGLPAEQYAIKTGQHPAITTAANIITFRRQLKALGFAYDWEREIATTDPQYVRWTQWIFLQLYGSYFCDQDHRAKPVAELAANGWSREQIDEVRLAYVAETPVWWSPDLGTVLANEEVEEWKAKGHSVERRPLRQWMLRITAYAQRLIDELESLEWPEGIKLLQKNWIGRSEGSTVRFQLEQFDSAIEVFTTRPDTLFGATYMVLAPEHPLLAQITTAGQHSSVQAYQKACASKSDMDRGDLNKDKSGIFTGAYAINPVNDARIPVWIADYVMMGYGTGAIMAVPGHDERDFEFAQRFGLPIVEVVSRSVGVPPTPRSVGVPPTCAPYLNPEQEIQKHHSNQLPHWQQDAKLYFVTWRLADSLPADKLREWTCQRDAWLAQHPEPWSATTEQEYHETFSKSIDHWLDAGGGDCLLKDPAIAAIVADALRHFDGDRYLMDSFVVMPNHVHALFLLAPGLKLEDVIQSWKSFSAKKINEMLGREGVVWQREYWDRIVRDGEHRANLRNYIARNPGRAKLRDASYVLYANHVGGTPTLLEHVGGTPTLLEHVGGTPTLLEQVGGTPTLLEHVGGTPTPLEPAGGTPASLTAPFSEPGIAINSGFLDGLPTAAAKAAMIEWLEANNLGRRRVQYKLRDWLFSRQRYWGEPFPIVWQDGHHQAIAESELPLLAPPLDDYKPSGTPEPLLSKAREWVELADGSVRETNTMPQWAGSCWYYLRYCDPSNTDRFISREAETYWGQRRTDDPSAASAVGMVDLYVGGTEHAVLHLLYARFWHKVLFDLGHVTTPEPFQKLVNQGLILGEDGQKMSKSRGNVVNPDDVVSEYGADALRLYEMFMGPLEQVKPWQMKGVEGVSRFLARVWRLALEQDEAGAWRVSNKIGDVPCAAKELRRLVHETIKKVGEDIEKLSFNTAISQMMICTNAFTQAEVVPLDEFIQFLTVLNPFAPHLTEEIHQRVAVAFQRPAAQLSEATWPVYDPSALVRSEVELVVQVNGKLRDRIIVSKDCDEAAATAAALASAKVKDHTDGKTIRKIVYIQGKLVNFVAN